MTLTPIQRARFCRRMAEAEEWIAREVGKVFEELGSSVPAAAIEDRLRAIFAGLLPEPGAVAPRRLPPPVAGPERALAPPQAAASPDVPPASGSAPLPTAKQRPLTAEEVAEALDRDARGETTRQIAAALGRSVKGFNFTLARLRRQAEAETCTSLSARLKEMAEEAAAPAAPVPPPAAPPPPSPPIAPPMSALADGNGWSSADDLRLAELLIGGPGVDDAVASLKRRRSEIIDRWKYLCPATSLDAQQKLLQRLRQAAA